MKLLTQSFPFLSESKTEFDELCKDADKLIMKYKMTESELILKHGRGLFPVLIYKEGHGYKISKRIKGYHKANVIKSDIVRRKIEVIKNWHIKQGAILVDYSMTTKSIYLTYNNAPLRISDHKKEFEGGQIIVSYDTDLSDFNINK